MRPVMSNAPNQACCCCSNQNCRKTEIVTDYPKKKLLTRAIESFYDNCAAYNLRYIPYRTVTDRKTCLTSIVKDLIILFCFLVTNFIVFLTILSRIAMHLFGMCMATIDWIKQVLVSPESPTTEATKSLYSFFSIKSGGTVPTMSNQSCNNECC